MKTSNNATVPHPFPYQGSKRAIASRILAYFPNDVHRLIEPFCGSGAVSIAASACNMAEEITLSDLNEPLMGLWREILERPERLADEYETLWREQREDKKEYFFRIRNEFNSTHLPHHLLYLLARIVKGSVRYSSDGSFNQSADNRRLGMRPSTMRKNILGVSRLLGGKTSVSSGDFRAIVKKAREKDLVYMDPPYQGTSFTRDHRYLSGLTYDDFVDALSAMNEKHVSYVVSYDGATGAKTHGKPLPDVLSLKHLYIHAGRSSQSTLLGNSDETIESLYLSPALTERLSEQSYLLSSIPAYPGLKTLGLRAQIKRYPQSANP